MSQYEDLSDFSIVVRALVECFFEKNCMLLVFRFDQAKGKKLPNLRSYGTKLLKILEKKT